MIFKIIHFSWCFPLTVYLSVYAWFITINVRITVTWLSAFTTRSVFRAMQLSSCARIAGVELHNYFALLRPHPSEHLHFPLAWKQQPGGPSQQSFL